MAGGHDQYDPVQNAASQLTVGDIRDIVSCITFTCNVHLAAVQAKGVDEVFEPAKELRSNFELVCSRRCTLTEASADWLFHPDRVCQVTPCVLIVDGCESAVRPHERSIFL